jgi:hypothetical protein
MRYTTSSGKTAISRDRASAPCRKLWGKTLAPKMYGSSPLRVIDHGCGKGSDVAYLKGLGCDIQGYDPNHHDVRPAIVNPDFILSTYVMNVLFDEHEEEWLEDIASLMGFYSIALITFRTDIKKEGRTSKGTFQKSVVLPRWCTLEAKGSGFKTYRFTKENLKRLAADRYALRHFGRYPEDI